MKSSASMSSTSLKSVQTLLANAPADSLKETKLVCTCRNEKLLTTSNINQRDALHARHMHGYPHVIEQVQPTTGMSVWRFARFSTKLPRHLTFTLAGVRKLRLRVTFTCPKRPDDSSAIPISRTCTTLSCEVNNTRKSAKELQTHLGHIRPRCSALQVQWQHEQLGA